MVENMNMSQDKPMIRSVGQTAFAREARQSAKRVLAVLTRWFHTLDAVQNEVVPAHDGSMGVVNDLGRAALIRFRTVMRDSRRPQRLFVPIASFDYENFGVTVRRIATHQRPPMGIVFGKGTKARSRPRPGIAASAPNPLKTRRCKTKNLMPVASAPPAVTSLLP